MYIVFDPGPCLAYAKLPMLGVPIIAHKYSNCICSSNNARDTGLPTCSYVDKSFDTGQVFKVALGRVDMHVEHNGNFIKSYALCTLPGESIANSFLCSFADATAQIEEQYIVDLVRSFSSGRALELGALYHALTFTMVLRINETVITRDEPLEFVVAITKKASLEINSTFSIPRDLVMFDIHKALDGCCYQLLVGQYKLLCPQLGLGLAQCLEVIPFLLSTYSHAHPLHRDVWNLLQIPVCDITVWTAVIFGSILDGDFSSTAEFLTGTRQKGGCIVISLDLKYPFGILITVLHLASRQLFDTENAHEDALLKMVGILAATSVHYTALVRFVSAIPLALTYGERATIFCELEKSIPNNNLGQVARIWVMEFREALAAGADTEQYVLKSHVGGSFTVMRESLVTTLAGAPKLQ
ncbi:hypothetical protein A4A49_18583 [Nicotiana attenuata]|uniref:Uncharacterized protein n=1 Tax=Nicotiana attenuata TaxID=49451 RepID=A0A1J6I9P7_NICAT|nr:hypothetical protein A4A49_18583 [Nicotiana attenuata]